MIYLVKICACGVICLDTLGDNDQVALDLGPVEKFLFCNCGNYFQISIFDHNTNILGTIIAAEEKEG